MMRNQWMLSPFFLDERVPALEPLAESDWRVNLPELPDGNQQARMSAVHRPLADLVTDAIAQGKRPVSIAGDCCTALGVLAGIQRVGLNPTLIWLDAHGDFNTWDTTPSGFLGGMPLAMMVGQGDLTMAEAVGLQPLAESQVILTDARDLDPGERTRLHQSAVTHLPDVNALRECSFVDTPLYIHFDTDILRPEDAPAMKYLAPQGPSAAELREVFAHLAHTSKIAAVSMTTWDPALDADGRSREICMSLLHALIEPLGGK
ncbi:hypothetical protein GF339_01050 [candidate division KSB3 bacterium]|uniref:Arginase n=1 Tax=candidate division KSB3 bacterium TaxID=2044937 RepID=A0A9D5JSE1_9BACT|nr:hypothetical protein [candidate division KSB3 bacterium]MBD3323137.1 hypothetical protein [candidate division KSB3 bacterium]